MALEDIQEINMAIGTCCMSEYFPNLYKYITVLGFNIDNRYVVCALDKDGSAKCKYVSSLSLNDADIWIELPSQQLYDFWYSDTDHVDAKIITSNTNKIPITVQILALRIFQKQFDKKYPITDREELIYRTLFSFKEPAILWESPQHKVRALLYPDAYEGYDVYVSSGFSNPAMKPAALRSDEFKIMGYGYELIMFAKPDASFLRDIFVYGVQSICETKHHLMRDHWVRFDKGFPHDTGGLAGLVVVTPTWVPEYFPLQSGVVYWNLLVGVGKEELTIAEKHGVEATLLEKWDAEQRGDATEIK